MTTSIDALAGIARNQARQDSGFAEGDSQSIVAPTGPLKTVADVFSPERSDHVLKSLIDFFQGQIKNERIAIYPNAKRVNVDIPLINKWGGLISAQGSYSPWGNNSFGFKYNRNW